MQKIQMQLKIFYTQLPNENLKKEHKEKSKDGIVKYERSICSHFRFCECLKVISRIAKEMYAFRIQTPLFHCDEKVRIKKIHSRNCTITMPIMKRKAVHRYRLATFIPFCRPANAGCIDSCCEHPKRRREREKKS